PDAEHPLPDLFARGTFPPRAGAACRRTHQFPLARPGPDRTPFLHHGQHVVHQRGRCFGELAVVPPPAPRFRTGMQQRPVLHRNEAGLVGPALHEQPRPPRAVRPRGGVHEPTVVRAQPGEQRRVVCSHHHVDRVELKQSQPGQHPLQMSAGGSDLWAWVGESLRGQSRTTGDVEAERSHDRHRASTPRRIPVRHGTATVTAMTTADVRPATLDDVPEIARIQLVTWRTAYGDALGPSVVDALTTDEVAARWSEAITHPDTTVYVATEGRFTVGFCVAGAAPETEVAAAD